AARNGRKAARSHGRKAARNGRKAARSHGCKAARNGRKAARSHGRKAARNGRTAARPQGRSSHPNRKISKNRLGFDLVSLFFESFLLQSHRLGGCTTSEHLISQIFGICDAYLDFLACLPPPTHYIPL
ncbi:MAG: hypothetical protein GY820_20690, partial [Gammaproteobacteria bacterium]|nr:hypothetical protein [Gammaproteobacteria bacterium]